MNTKSFKVSLLIIAIIGLTFHPVVLYAQQLFSVNQNGFSNEKVAQLTTQIEKSEISALSLTKNNESKDVYRVALSSVQNTNIIILNEQTRSNIVITPVNESFTEFQLTPFFIEELKRGALGDAEHYLVIEATSDDVAKKTHAVSTSNGEVFIPRYFYGAKENVQEALPKDRQIIGIFKAKPRLISAFPDDPEVQKQIAQLEEAMSYHVYMFKLPDGTLCTYDEHFNPDNEQGQSSAIRGSLQFNLTGQMNAAERNATEYALGLWSEQLQGKVAVDTRIDLIDMGDPMILGSSYPMPSFLNNQTKTWYPSSLWNQLAGYDATTMNDIRIEMNSIYSWYHGTDGKTPSSLYDYPSVILHEVNHGLGFADNIFYESGNSYSGIFYYIDFDDNGNYKATDCPNIFSRQLFQGTSGPCVTELTQSQRAALLVSNNLYAGAPGSKLLQANGGARVKVHAPSTYKPGSSASHWDESVSFITFMKWATGPGIACHTISDRELGILFDMGWIAGGGTGSCAGVTNMTVNFNANCEAQISWSAPSKGIMLAVHPEENPTEELSAPPANGVFSSYLSHFEKPESLVEETGSRDGGWIRWCGNNVDAIGTGQPVEFIVAARITPSDLAGAGITNGKLTKVRFVPWYTAGISFAIGIFQGGTSPTNSGSLVYEQAVTQPLTAYQYNEITLSTPISINTSQELWITYYLKITQYDQYPAGCDSGPRVVGKGDLMFYGGSWSNLFDLTSGKTSANWNIEGYVESGGNPPPPPCNYNVYRDGVKIASNITTTNYLDSGADPYKNHTWSVKVVCDDGGESVADKVTKGCKVGINENANTTFLVYPNPTNGELRISLPNPSEGGAYEATGVKNIEIIDIFGRSVYIAHPPLRGGLEGLNISHLPSGIYFLRIQTETGAIVMKKVIKK